MGRTMLSVAIILAGVGLLDSVRASDRPPHSEPARLALVETAPTSDSANLRTELVAVTALKAPPGPILGGPECAECDQAIDRCHCDSYRWRVFSQWMLLQPRGSDIVFAESAVSCIEPTLGTEQIDYGFYSGFKVGFARTLHQGYSELATSFSYFRADENESVTASAGTVLRPTLTLVPSCDNLTSLFAAASTDVEFQRVDIDYRKFFTWGCTQFDCSIGFGYGNLAQTLNVEYGSSGAALDNLVDVDSDVYGYGVRFGSGAQCDFWSCVSTFGRADLTLLASNVKASYRQTNLTGPDSGEFSQDFDRIVPIVDLEIGLAVDLWRHSAVKVGYNYSIWFNVPTTEEIVSSVQQSDFNDDISDTLSFDGLFVRFEYLW